MCQVTYYWVWELGAAEEKDLEFEVKMSQFLTYRVTMSPNPEKTAIYILFPDRKIA